MIFLLFFLSYSTAWPQLPRVSLYVEDFQGEPISGVVIVPKKGSALAPTDDNGRTILTIAYDVQKGEEIELITTSGSQWVFLKPPFKIPFPGSSEKTVTVSLARKIERDILRGLYTGFRGEPNFREKDQYRATVDNKKDSWVKVTWATLFVEDLQREPIEGIEIAPKQGSSTAPTDENGRTTLVITRKVRPGEEVELTLAAGSQWTFLKPRNTFRVPDSPRKPVTVFLVRKVDRKLLVSPQERMALITGLLEIIDAKYKIKPRLGKKFLYKIKIEKLAETLGIPLKKIDDLISSWEKERKDDSF